MPPTFRAFRLKRKFGCIALVTKRGGIIAPNERLPWGQTIFAGLQPVSAGNLTLNIGNFSLSGIGTACFSSIIIYQLLRGRGTEAEEATVAADAQTKTVIQDNHNTEA